MSKEKRSSNLPVAPTIAAVLAAAGAAETSRANPGDALRTAQRRVMDVLARLYDKTDSSPVAGYTIEDPGKARNPSGFFIPLSLGNGYLNRFESRDHIPALHASMDRDRGDD